MLRESCLTEVSCSTAHACKHSLSMPFVHFSSQYTPIIHSSVFACYSLILDISCSWFITCMLLFVLLFFDLKMSKLTLSNHGWNEDNLCTLAMRVQRHQNNSVSDLAHLNLYFPYTHIGDFIILIGQFICIPNLDFAVFFYLCTKLRELLLYVCQATLSANLSLYLMQTLSK